MPCSCNLGHCPECMGGWTPSELTEKGSKLEDIKSVDLLLEFKRRFINSVLLESQINRFLDIIGEKYIVKHLREKEYRVHKKRDKPGEIVLNHTIKTDF